MIATLPTLYRRPCTIHGLRIVDDSGRAPQAVERKGVCYTEAHTIHQETCHIFFGLIRARTSLYELKSRQVDEEPRIQKKLIFKFIFRRSEAQKSPLFFSNRKVDK